MLTATLATDQQDYAPGSTAQILADGFAPGEPVQFQVLHTDGTPDTGGGHAPWIVTDGGPDDLDHQADGHIQTTWYVNPDDSLGSRFALSASGLTSGEVANANFTDSAIVVTADTAWSAITTGSGTNGQPAASDTILVRSGATLTVDVAAASAASVQLGGSNAGEGSGTLLFLAGSSLAVNGSATVGTANNAGTLNMTSGGTLQVGASGSLSVTGGSTFTPGSGTVEYNGTGAQTVAALNYNNLTISGARTTNSVTLASSGTIGVAGAFTTTATFSSGGYVTAGSTVAYNGVGAQTVMVFNYNHLTISGARTTNSVTLASSGTLGVSGSFNAAASFTTGTYVTTGSTVDFNGAGTQSLASGGVSFNKVTHSGAGTLQLGASLTTTGTFTNSAGTFDINGQTASLGTLSLTGGTIQGGTITSSNAYDL